MRLDETEYVRMALYVLAESVNSQSLLVEIDSIGPLCRNPIRDGQVLPPGRPTPDCLQAAEQFPHSHGIKHAGTGMINPNPNLNPMLPTLSLITCQGKI